MSGYLVRGLMFAAILLAFAISAVIEFVCLGDGRD